MEVFYEFIVLSIILFKKIERTFYSLFYPFLRVYIKNKLKVADISVTINGENPQDIIIANDENERKFIIALAAEPSLALGEAYMKKFYECEKLDELVYKILKSGLHKEYLTSVNRFINYLLFNVVNLQTRARVLAVGVKHYDIGNDLFEGFLDSSMNYSCGYWRRAENLDEAQEHKMKLIGDKLKLRPGMKVLDIGCGGSLCKYLAENYNVKVLGITISKEQMDTAKQKCSGLPVRIELIDYRDLNEKFDRIVSVEMFEHVGEKNYKEFFQVVNKCLEDDGLFLLHSTGVNEPGVPLSEPWYHTYIFPNITLPYHQHITKYTDGLFIIEDWQNLSGDYAKTLSAWRTNFINNWPKLKHKYGETFYRMWYYYFSTSIGAFRARKFQLWQIVLSKNGIEGGYESIR